MRYIFALVNVDNSCADKAEALMDIKKKKTYSISLTFDCFECLIMILDSTNGFGATSAYTKKKKSKP